MKIARVWVVVLITMAMGCDQRPATVQEGTMAVNENNGDMGQRPWVLDIEEATIGNDNYRTAKWTGEYMQMVLMSLKPGEIIDLEVHDDHDQFIRIEQGEAVVLMGETRDNLNYERNVSDDWAIFIPAGYWHQVRNTGNADLKLYTIYAPSEHPAGTIQRTYQEAAAQHHDH
jgi:mannose-6-phosphate isomerase-like protein (cupin superfamily)